MFILFVIYRTNWIIVNGVKYQTPCVLIVDTTISGDLIFGNVANIYFSSQTDMCLFQFKPIQAEFYEHYHAYARSPLTASPSYLIKHMDLACYHPYSSYSCNHIPSEETLRLTVIRSNVYVQL